MLCWGALGVSEPVPCSQLVGAVSLQPPGEQQLCAGAGCAVLPAWSKSCLSLGDPAGICRVVTALGQGVSRAVFAPRVSVLCEGTVQSQRLTSRGTWLC